MIKMQQLEQIYQQIRMRGQEQILIIPIYQHQQFQQQQRINYVTKHMLIQQIQQLEQIYQLVQMHGREQIILIPIYQLQQLPLQQPVNCVTKHMLTLYLPIYQREQMRGLVHIHLILIYPPGTHFHSCPNHCKSIL